MTASMSEVEVNPIIRRKLNKGFKRYVLLGLYHESLFRSVGGIVHPGKIGPAGCKMMSTRRVFFNVDVDELTCYRKSLVLLQ